MESKLNYNKEFLATAPFSELKSMMDFCIDEINTCFEMQSDIEDSEEIKNIQAIIDLTEAIVVEIRDELVGRVINSFLPKQVSNKLNEEKTLNKLIKKGIPE